MPTLKEKTISSLFWRFMERGGSAVISLVVQIFLARLLTPEDFGSLAIILVFINLSTVIAQSGFNTAIVQFPNIDDEDISTVFWLCIALAAILFAVLFLSAPYIALFYSTEDIVWPLRVLAVGLFLNIYSGVLVAIITRSIELKKTFKATMLSLIVSGFAGIVAAILGAGIWALVIQSISSAIISCTVLTFQVHWRPRICFKAHRALEMFGFSWKLLASSFLNTAYQSLSSLIIGKQFSGSELGYVTQGEKYPQALGNTLDGTIQPVVLSAVARLQDDKESVKGFISRALKTSAFIVVPVMGAFALMADSLIRLVLGEQWLPAVPFLQMYCFVYALLPIHTSNLQALNGVGRSDVFLKLEIVKKIMGVALICIASFLIQNVYAIVGSFMVSSVLSTFINAYPSKKILNYGLAAQIKDIAPSFLLTAAAMAFASLWYLLGLPSIAVVVLQCLTIVAVYAALAKLFKVEEFEYLVSTLKGYIPIIPIGRGT